MSFFLTALFFLVALIFAILYLYQQHRVSRLQNDLDIAQSTLFASKDAEKRLQEKIGILSADLQHASHDPVTYLPTWQFFEDRLKQNIKESERYQLSLGLMLVDIDGFKVIRNALGHEMGDVVLGEVAKRLQSCIRQVDSITRMNEDTFALLLTKLAKPETAAIVAQRVLKAFEQTFMVNEKEIKLAVSIGIAIYPADGLQSAAIIRNAGQALGFAKSEKSSKFHFYQDQMSYDSKRELAISLGLGSEHMLNELVRYYQPVMNTATKAIFCMDVSLSWHHPELGLIPADQFEQLSEKLNKSQEMLTYTVRGACQQFVSWKALGFNPEHLAISLSTKQLSNAQFIYQLSNIFQECDFKPEHLIIYAKSSSDQLSFDLLEKAFNMLDYLGVKIAMDDYGATAFPLWYLKVFPIKYLRLAPALVNDVASNPQTLMLVKSVLRLAQDMSLEVIAQTVDSKEQHDALQAIGCHLMEGRFWNELMTEEQVKAQMLSSHSSE